MNRRFWAVAAALVLNFLPADLAVASNRPVTRQDIRQTPILQRPNRPGHFYGNTVRRRSGRHTG